MKLDVDTPAARDLALRQMEFARAYTQTLLEGLTDAEWTAFPAGAATCVAWQVGHLAMAQYGLCLFRQRGRAESDLQLMSGAFRKLFSKGSTPAPDAPQHPSVAEIRQVFDRVHAQVLREVPTFAAESLAEPTDPPHAVFETKLGALLFAPAHEMLHAGQIGLLRRLLGKPPIR